MRELESWPSSLISEWLAADQLGMLPDFPWGFGLIASVMANAWGKQRTTPEDFVPKVRTRRKQGMAEQQAIFQQLAAIQRARIT